MPQMNPMWWFSLFIIFVMTFLLTNSLNYFYSKNYISSNLLEPKKNKIINWKW